MPKKFMNQFLNSNRAEQVNSLLFCSYKITVLFCKALIFLTLQKSHITSFITFISVNLIILKGR